MQRKEKNFTIILIGIQINANLYRVLEYHAKNKKMNKLPLSYVSLILFYCCSLLVSNIMAIKIFCIGSFFLSTAVIIFPITYIIADCVSEIWGFSYARFMIFCGFAVNVFFAVFISLAVALPTAGVSESSRNFDVVLQQNPQIVIAAFLAFIVGALMDSLLLCKMKAAYQGKKFFFRAIASTIIGELADSFIFFPIAYWGAMNPFDIFILGTGEYCLKILYEIALFPLLAFLVTVIKKKERADVVS